MSSTVWRQACVQVFRLVLADYMDDDCSLTRVLHLENATKTYGFVRPMRTGGYDNNMKCNITIYAPKVGISKPYYIYMLVLVVKI